MSGDDAERSRAFAERMLEVLDDVDPDVERRRCLALEREASGEGGE